jgi:cell division protein FtsI/penicillin-binding protein 2
MPEPETVFRSAAVRTLGNRVGAVAVADVASGRLLTVHNLPLASRRLVRPGSIVKPFTLIALLESNTITPDTALICRRQLRLAGRELDCVHVRTPEPLDAVAALAYSCNWFFAEAAARLSNAELQQTFMRAGLGSRTGWSQDEAVGTVTLSPNQDQLRLQALGESNLMVTPLAVLSAYRKLATRRLAADAATAVVFSGLEAAVEYGTAQLARPEGMKVAGKTGTSSADEGRWTHAWFAGFAPADKPEIAVVVFLERGHGGGDAAGIAREIFSAYQQARRARGAAPKRGDR